MCSPICFFAHGDFECHRNERRERSTDHLNVHSDTTIMMMLVSELASYDGGKEDERCGDIVLTVINYIAIVDVNLHIPPSSICILYIMIIYINMHR